jgi:thioredoxin 2
MSTETRCPSCGARNRVPVVAKGRPRCGTCKTDLPWLVDAGDTDFDAAISASVMPVLVDLWAPWCGPCRMVAPALENIAADHAGKLRVLKVNVDESPIVAGRLGAQSIPTLVLFDGGNEVARQIGAHPEHGIRSWIDASLT